MRCTRVVLAASCLACLLLPALASAASSAETVTRRHMLHSEGHKKEAAAAAAVEQVHPTPPEASTRAVAKAWVAMHQPEHLPRPVARRAMKEGGHADQVVSNTGQQVTTQDSKKPPSNAGKGQRVTIINTLTPCTWIVAEQQFKDALVEASGNNSLLMMGKEQGNCSPNLDWVFQEAPNRKNQGSGTGQDILSFYQVTQVCGSIEKVGECDQTPWCGWDWQAEACQAAGESVMRFLQLCRGTRAARYYDCNQGHKTRGSCRRNKNCRWRPALSPDTDLKCFSKDVPEALSSPDELYEWMAADFDNVTNAQFWGTTDGQCGKLAGNIAAYTYLMNVYAANAGEVSDAEAEQQCGAAFGMWRWSVVYNKWSEEDEDFRAFNCPGAPERGCFSCWPDMSYFSALLYGYEDSWVKRVEVQCTTPLLSERGRQACQSWILV